MGSDAYEDVAYSGKFTEEQLEVAIIGLLEEQGYAHADGRTLHRRFEDVLLDDRLAAFLRRRYSCLLLTDSEVQTCVNRLKLIAPTPLLQASRETFRLVNEGFDLVREEPGAPVVHIDYVDFDDPEANDFLAVNQFSVADAALRRPDLLLFVNGIPLVIFEFKTAIEEDKTVHDAWEQITVRYARDIPRLLRYCCLAVVCDGANTRVGTVFTPYEHFYSWNRDPGRDGMAVGVEVLYTTVAGLFSKERLCAVLRDFIWYPDDGSCPVVCRNPQFFAANKLLSSICHHMRPGGDGKGGTYFGATGCGKTYTMLFLSRLLALRRTDLLRNPTVVVIVDREDLDAQTARVFSNAKGFLRTDDVRSIESRADLRRTLAGRPSGGVFITTIQKFSEDLGLLSERENIVVLSDEAHRTQVNTGSKLVVTDKGAFTSYGFAKHLRDGFPNAVYCGFTGTPIDETIAVFGPVVDSYSMQASKDDGITVPIAYEPRLARVLLSDEEARRIQEYYERCATEGSTPEQIEESQQAMSSLSVILRNPERIQKLAADMVRHYEALCAERPGVVQKAMVVCSDRFHAYDVYLALAALRPEWCESRRAADEGALPKDELEELSPVPFLNLVATRGADDPPGLYELCGTKERRSELDRLFKDERSNFQVAVVVDMWVTGFDVASLAVMYVDKPLQKHTLVQTISRVNRVHEGKECGLVVDYIGIRDNMVEALKTYGSGSGDVVAELTATLGIFRNYLDLVGDVMYGFDADRFLCGEPMERLACLNDAAEYVQAGRQRQTDFMAQTRVLRQAYAICAPSGELTDRECALAQFYLAVRSIIYKQTKGDAPDAAMMNDVVERMVERAISCTGVESVLEAAKAQNLYSEEFKAELAAINMPITKFNALLKLLRRSISDYRRVNKVRALDFDERLRRVVDAYNTRDNLQFASEVAADFVDGLSDQLLAMLRDLEEDRGSFERMGISFEKKAFYDILVRVRDDHGFEYADERCVDLAKQVRELVDDKAQYADWSTREDIKADLQMELIRLLYRNGYPPTWSEEVFEKVLEQAENFKANEG